MKTQTLCTFAVLGSNIIELPAVNITLDERSFGLPEIGIMPTGMTFLRAVTRIIFVGYFNIAVIQTQWKQTIA